MKTGAKYSLEELLAESKISQSAADLSAVLTDLGQEPDMEIIEKLTGKAAIYFTEILRKLEQSIEA